MMSIEKSNPILRVQNALALCLIVILGLVWKIYDDQLHLQKDLSRIEDVMRSMDKEMQKKRSLSIQENQKSRVLQLRNALFAMVPCARSPGGLCPVTNNASRRLIMLRQLLKRSKDLKGINLQGLDLRNIDFSGVNLSYAQLDYSNLSKSNLQKVDFRHASMIGTDLSESNLQKAILAGANLSGAGLEKADLSGAQLQVSNLRGAHACQAKFDKTKLGGAWLQGAYLWGANLSQTRLAGTYRGAYIGKDTKWQNKVPTDVVITDYKAVHLTAGVIATISPAYGPAAAPFLQGNPTNGTVCPLYLQEVVNK